MLVGHLASTKEDMGSAKEDPHIMDTAKTGVGIRIRKVKGMDRLTLQGIKEYPQEQPKTKRLRMQKWVMSRLDHLKIAALRVLVNHQNLTHRPHKMPSRT